MRRLLSQFVRTMLRRRLRLAPASLTLFGPRWATPAPRDDLPCRPATSSHCSMVLADALVLPDDLDGVYGPSFLRPAPALAEQITKCSTIFSAQAPSLVHHADFAEDLEPPSLPRWLNRRLDARAAQLESWTALHLTRAGTIIATAPSGEAAVWSVPCLASYAIGGAFRRKLEAASGAPPAPRWLLRPDGITGPGGQGPWAPVRSSRGSRKHAQGGSGGTEGPARAGLSDGTVLVLPRLTAHISLASAASKVVWERSRKYRDLGVPGRAENKLVAFKVQPRDDGGFGLWGGGTSEQPRQGSTDRVERFAASPAPPSGAVHQEQQRAAGPGRAGGLLGAALSAPAGRAGRRSPSGSAAEWRRQRADSSDSTGSAGSSATRSVASSCAISGSVVSRSRTAASSAQMRQSCEALLRLRVVGAGPQWEAVAFESFGSCTGVPPDLGDATGGRAVGGCRGVGSAAGGRGSGGAGGSRGLSGKSRKQQKKQAQAERRRRELLQRQRQRQEQLQGDEGGGRAPLGRAALSPGRAESMDSAERGLAERPAPGEPRSPPRGRALWAEQDRKKWQSKQSAHHARARNNRRNTLPERGSPSEPGRGADAPAEGARRAAGGPAAGCRLQRDSLDEGAPSSFGDARSSPGAGRAGAVGAQTDALVAPADVLSMALLSTARSRRSSVGSAGKGVAMAAGNAPVVSGGPLVSPVPRRAVPTPSAAAPAPAASGAVPAAGRLRSQRQPRPPPKGEVLRWMQRVRRAVKRGQRPPSPPPGLSEHVEPLETGRGRVTEEEAASETSSGPMSEPRRRNSVSDADVSEMVRLYRQARRAEAVAAATTRAEAEAGRTTADPFGAGGQWGRSGLQMAGAESRAGQAARSLSESNAQTLSSPDAAQGLARHGTAAISSGSVHMPGLGLCMPLGPERSSASDRPVKRGASVATTATATGAGRQGYRKDVAPTAQQHSGAEAAEASQEDDDLADLRVLVSRPRGAWEDGIAGQMMARVTGKAASRANAGEGDCVPAVRPTGTGRGEHAASSTIGPAPAMPTPAPPSTPSKSGEAGICGGAVCATASAGAAAAGRSGGRRSKHVRDSRTPQSRGGRQSGLQSASASGPRKASTEDGCTRDSMAHATSTEAAATTPRELAAEAAEQRRSRRSHSSADRSAELADDRSALLVLPTSSDAASLSSSAGTRSRTPQGRSARQPSAGNQTDSDGTRGSTAFRGAAVQLEQDAGAAHSGGSDVDSNASDSASHRGSASAELRSIDEAVVRPAPSWVVASWVTEVDCRTDATENHVTLWNLVSFADGSVGLARPESLAVRDAAPLAAPDALPHMIPRRLWPQASGTDGTADTAQLDTAAAAAMDQAVLLSASVAGVSTGASPASPTEAALVAAAMDAASDALRVRASLGAGPHAACSGSTAAPLVESLRPGRTTAATLASHRARAHGGVAGEAPLTAQSRPPWLTRDIVWLERPGRAGKADRLAVAAVALPKPATAAQLQSCAGRQDWDSHAVVAAGIGRIVAVWMVRRRRCAELAPPDAASASSGGPDKLRRQHDQSDTVDTTMTYMEGHGAVITAICSRANISSNSPPAAVAAATAAGGSSSTPAGAVSLPGGVTMASGDASGEVRMWASGTARCIAHLRIDGSAPVPSGSTGRARAAAADLRRVSAGRLAGMAGCGSGRRSTGGAASSGHTDGSGSEGHCEDSRSSRDSRGGTGRAVGSLAKAAARCGAEAVTSMLMTDRLLVAGGSAGTVTVWVRRRTANGSREAKPALAAVLRGAHGALPVLRLWGSSGKAAAFLSAGSEGTARLWNVCGAGEVAGPGTMPLQAVPLDTTSSAGSASAVHPPSHDLVGRAAGRRLGDAGRSLAMGDSGRHRTAPSPSEALHAMTLHTPAGHEHMLPRAPIPPFEAPPISLGAHFADDFTLRRAPFNRGTALPSPPPRPLPPSASRGSSCPTASGLTRSGSVDGGPAPAGTAEVLSVISAPVIGHDARVTAACLNDWRAVTGDASGCVRYWEVGGRAGRLLRALYVEPPSAVASITVAPSGDTMLVGTADRRVLVVAFPPWVPRGRRGKGGRFWRAHMSGLSPATSTIHAGASATAQASLAAIAGIGASSRRGGRARAQAALAVRASVLQVPHGQADAQNSGRTFTYSTAAVQRSAEAIEAEMVARALARSISEQ